MNRDRWDRVNKKLREAPDEFSLWQELIEAAESLENGLNKTSSAEAIELFRDTFRSFLHKFPLMHGYWIRYAKNEFKFGFTHRAVQVFEQAVSTVPGSVQLWTRYCEFMALVETHEPNAARALFNRAAEAIGSHFYAHEFWDKYLEFEEQQEEPENVFKILQKASQQPIHQYARYYQQFREMINSVPVEIAVPEEKLQQFRAEQELDYDSLVIGSDVGVSLEADLRARIDYYYSIAHQKIHDSVSKRWRYESKLQRFFFHVVYVPESDMVNWRNYLQFEHINKDDRAIRLLYERAAASTGLNEEFWIDYARYLISQGDTNEAINVLRRGSLVVPIGRVELRHYYASICELTGYSDMACAIYEAILDQLPSSAETIKLFAGLKCRQESVGEAIAFLSAKLEDDTVASETKAILTLQQAAYLKKEHGMARARALLVESEPQFTSNLYFWREYLRFEINSVPDKKSTDKRAIVERVYDQMRNSELDQLSIKDLTHIYMDYILSESVSDNAQAAQTFIKADSTVHKTATVWI